ncbi:hypothetical protein M2459_003431 [Parabacteroides sp. PF5-5]|uniref:hypothetical protein n=1 Tax=unclassified Parabacteroides TaxID=2649774 RepID=UPI00247728F1|nr:MULTISPECIES: hypothetical protein [unclassified Parabacteroides]MDH6306785.1 hypothetical protein [Parabacteroides sp. PH5-39]MDH6317671.1 hypothetical protein [Parabacteroides sp. PF5-13]MDH6321497.1 hypothetical protein [Parabacteroides sp. PH5-13]MDH6325226.1 hypothetical protein [Parabacteroides sp. PH5-8]MDH6328856.1 hypothetical protein [Parabacteroides sp. PH5-41]
MKRTILLLTVCILGIGALAQENANSNYLFDTFQRGTVYYKDGRQFVVDLNYNPIIKKFLFIDVSYNNSIKEFGEPELVTLIKTGDRTFLHDKNKIREVLQIEPPLLVQYNAIVKDKGRKAGYGGYSTTSAIESYAGIHSGGVYHEFAKQDRYSLSRLSKIYYIEYNKKKKCFATAKEFLKIFPEHKASLQKHIEDNQTNFNSIEQVIQLYNYAVSLK